MLPYTAAKAATQYGKDAFQRDPLLLKPFRGMRLNASFRICSLLSKS